MSFKVGDRVEVYRRLDINDIASPREWAVAMVMHVDSHLQLVSVVFDDGYNKNGIKTLKYDPMYVRALATTAPPLKVGDRVKIRDDFRAYYQGLGYPMSQVTENAIKHVMGRVWIVRDILPTEVCAVAEDNGEVKYFINECVVKIDALPTAVVPKPLPDNCPKCGHRGNWVRMALVCPAHGMWAGC